MDVLMPQLGETVAEGKITKWFKSAGDAVKPGDNLFEIETDKVSMEVPAISSGVLQDVRVAAGETALVGAVVAVIAGAADVAGSAPVAAPAAAKAPKAAAPLAAAVPQPVFRQAGLLDPFFEVRTPARNYGPAKQPGGTVATPLARRLATEGGIDLRGLKSSGPHGRIVAADVEAALAQCGLARSAGAFGGPSADQVKALYQGVPFEEVPVDGMRRTIATRLVEAKQTVPHFYLTADVELDRLIKLREEVNSGRPDGKLSLNDFVIKALALALQRVPAANAAWAGDRILRFQHSDIGVAVAIDGGLLTPIVRKAEEKSLSAISREMKDLAARARAKTLTPAEYQGGASAISNLGMYGVREFAAIINPPQASILAIGAAQRQPVETEDGGLKFVSRMSATLSCDHRVIDGAPGAELLAAFRALIENPLAMLI
jgi:pyruvate dehydrogenase E2 component (dihydrolipoamide acetyltransferase)